MNIDYSQFNYCTRCRKKVPKKAYCDSCDGKTRWTKKFTSKKNRPLMVKPRV